MRSALPVLGLVPALLSGAAACGGPARLAYDPLELRAQVERRAPSLTPAEVVVPYEVTPAQMALARKVVKDARGDIDRVEALTAALFDPEVFHLRYAEGITATAQETLARGEGNCLGLASVFIGLARAVGLEAYYMDASTRVHETRDGADGMTVNAGHVTAVVRAGGEDMGLDFARLGTIRWYRVIDDVEALAHFYNNRGFDLIENALEADQPVPWDDAARDFHRALAVLPGFARAWNNLGIAAARRGLVDEAVADYRAAIERDPRLAAPRYNLGVLYLAAGDPAAALPLLEEAARIEPGAPHIEARLAQARQLTAAPAARGAAGTGPAAPPARP